jgi:predicted ATPase with chaperone activity
LYLSSLGAVLTWWSWTLVRRMNQFNVLGLPDHAVKEGGERIKAAWKNRTLD